MRAVALALVAAAAAAPPARAQPAPGDAIRFKVENERTRAQAITLLSLGGSAVVFGAVGLAFNLDSRDKSSQVSRSGPPSGLVWTAEREEIREAAIRSRNLAIAGYAVGGGLALATIIYYIATDPGEREVSYAPGAPVGAAPSLLLAPGGAVLGARWSFR